MSYTASSHQVAIETWEARYPSLCTVYDCIHQSYSPSQRVMTLSCSSNSAPLKWFKFDLITTIKTFPVPQWMISVIQNTLHLNKSPSSHRIRRHRTQRGSFTSPDTQASCHCHREANYLLRGHWWRRSGAARCPPCSSWPPGRGSGRAG